MNRKLVVLATTILLAGHNASHATELNNWPQEASKSLSRLISKFSNSGQYAVFDMDNTSYQHDLEEALLPFLEMKGVLTRERMDPSLKLIPFKDHKVQKESLYSYYTRLCKIDDKVCYPWVAQIFSGFTLRELKSYVDELMTFGKPIPASYFEGDEIVSTQIQPPKPFTGQQELMAKLMENGIEVYVITAASEELVRMVASDPKYGYNVKPENVIGVTMLLRDRASGELTTSRKQIAEADTTSKRIST